MILTRYDTAGQLKGLVMPGITGSSFNYNSAGELTSSSLTDATTGTVSTSINTLDDLGRALSTTSGDNGSSNTTTNSYTALGDPNVETFSSAGNANVGHGYYPAANAPSTGAPDAMARRNVI
jgi:YD repeat-containing protein